jgi:CheY-like chemotaxis protein
MARILVVDDDERNLRLASAALEAGRAPCGRPAKRSEGIESARRSPPPDLVLMDVQDAGHERYRGDADPARPSGTAALKVVALTALAMKGDRERMLAEGFDGYIEKPIRYKEFLASVAALLANRRGADIETCARGCCCCAASRPWSRRWRSPSRSFGASGKGGRGAGAGAAGGDRRMPWPRK